MENLRLALASLSRNGLRAVLTIVGISIGIASVLLVIALGDGAKKEMSKQLDSIGPTLVFVNAQRNAASGVRAKGTGRGLTEQDARAIERETISQNGVAPSLFTRQKVVFKDSNVLTQIVGVTIPYFRVFRWEIAAGRVWTESEEATRARVCLIGDTVRSNLFQGEDPIGQIVRIGKYPFTVIGTLAPKGTSLGSDNDDAIVMPLGGLRSRYFRSAQSAFVAGIVVNASSVDTVNREVDQISSLLTEKHRLREGAPKDFRIDTMKQFLELKNTVLGVLSVLLTLLSGISLLVGGIGIMNIMLVSVSERTREIGIRMAIGAGAKTIRNQFLVESITLSALGGIVGVLLAAVLIETVSSLLQWEMRVGLVPAFATIGLSAAIGIGFGYVPARRASMLDPIVALRRE